MKKNITIEIPLNLALEIATYGRDGKISETAQLAIERQVKLMGYDEELNKLRTQKLKETSENLRRILGSNAMDKLEDTLKIAKDAISVAKTMNNKN